MFLSTSAFALASLALGTAQAGLMSDQNGSMSMPGLGPNEICEVFEVVDHHIDINTCFEHNTIHVIQDCTTFTVMNAPTCITTQATSASTKDCHKCRINPHDKTIAPETTCEDDTKTHDGHHTRTDDHDHSHTHTDDHSHTHTHDHHTTDATTTTADDHSSTSTSSSPTTTPTDDREGFCGPRYHDRKCDAGHCCGKDGRCGTDIDACGTGCQAGFGDCGVSIDGKCGNGVTCEGSKFGNCCAWDGVNPFGKRGGYIPGGQGTCGDSIESCGPACRDEFGVCGVSQNGKCGNKVSCAGSEYPGCCSEGGDCLPSETCGPDCQKDLSAPMTCKPKERKKCGRKDGRDFGVCSGTADGGSCCGEDNYCSDKPDACVAGKCKPDFSVKDACGVSHDGTCKEGLACAGGVNGACCKDGLCSNSVAACGSNCKQEWSFSGACGHSQDGGCNDAVNCEGSPEGDCCSKTGKCGKTKEFCAKDYCNENGGKCGISMDGSCGSYGGGLSCDDSEFPPCCGKDNKCGDTSKSCSRWQGCQRMYGKCFFCNIWTGDCLHQALDMLDGDSGPNQNSNENGPGGRPQNGDGPGRQGQNGQGGGRGGQGGQNGQNGPGGDAQPSRGGGQGGQNGQNGPGGDAQPTRGQNGGQGGQNGQNGPGGDAQPTRGGGQNGQGGQGSPGANNGPQSDVVDPNQPTGRPQRTGGGNGGQSNNNAGPTGRP